MTTPYVYFKVTEDIKGLREALCAAQSHLLTWMPHGYQPQIFKLQELINECDRHRPLGPDGKHGDRHTATCGCEDKPLPPQRQCSCGEDHPADNRE